MTYVECRYLSTDVLINIGAFLKDNIDPSIHVKLKTTAITNLYKTVDKSKQ
ncbi:hypothetical protein CAL7716_058990 [Calothrix sp. PCC 7716]|nr:hypothetical protein CAL7716_058990 [Calothrix sp. PCC 7716]